MDRDDSLPDEKSSRSLGDLTEMVHVDVPLTDTYVLHGPAITFIRKKNSLSPEQKILGTEFEE